MSAPMVDRAGSQQQPRRGGLVLADTAGIIVGWEGDLEALTGHTAERAIGHSLDLIVPDGYRDRHWAGFRNALDSGAARAEGAAAAIPVWCADGVVRRFPGRFTLVRDALGHVRAAAAVLIEPAPDDPAFFPL